MVKGRALLGAAVLLAMLCVACGSGKSRSSPSSQGFVPAPNAPTMTVSGSTATSLPAATSPTPTPIGTPNVQASAQANGCNITPFATNSPPQVQDNFFPQWYGNSDLWFAPASTYAEFRLQRLANTTVWFQGITPTIVVGNQESTISGHLQGDPATKLVTSPSTTQPEQPSYGIDIDLPQPGCWDLNVASGGQSLNITIWVIPITQRPDVANIMAARTRLTPYAPPSTCNVTAWSGPTDHLAPFLADYWITGQGITVDSTFPLFFATQSSNLDIYQSLSDAPTISGQLQGDRSAVVRSSWIQRSSQMSANGWRGELTFSSPGCWQLRLTAGNAKVDLTLYVYPSDCYHALNEPKPATCKPPA